MKPFLKIVEQNGNVSYFNPDQVICIRPGDYKDFSASGADVEIMEGAGIRIYVTPAGEETDTVVRWLGLD